MTHFVTSEIVDAAYRAIEGFADNKTSGRQDLRHGLETAAPLILARHDTKLKAFAEQIARLFLEGEDNGDGVAFEQDGEDAQAALSHLIEEARRITGIKGPGKPICSHFQSDGRGCCINCDNFHGPEGSA